MLEQINEILNNMDQTDGNVIALKALIKALATENRVFLLKYNGKYLHYETWSHDNCEFCNAISYHMTTDDFEPVWSTTDLITAVYAKTINTPWYNSKLETPTWSKDIDLTKVQVVDNYGKVYNRKLLTYKTKAILYSKIRGENYYLKQIERYPELATTPIDSIYEQQELLNEMKKDRLKFAGKLPIRGLELSDCYDLRKKLISLKAEKIKANKSYKGLQQRLDKLNKRIKTLGGK